MRPSCYAFFSTVREYYSANFISLEMRPSCYTFFSTVRKYYSANNQFPIVNPTKNPKKITARKPKNVTVSNNSKIVWNDQHLRIIEAIKGGDSVFITGSAGTGKTTLVEHLIKLLVEIHGTNTVFVTASTGVAACALRGQTLQSFGGVGLAQADAETLLSRVLGNKRALKRWKRAKALVIDEISMVDKTLFDKFEYIARKVRCGSRKGSKAWGGIQLVVSGDFFQLPPVEERCEGVEFAFEADCWELSFQLFVQLETIFRQSNSEHIKLLEGIRVGEIDRKSLELLQQRCCKEEPDEAVMRLYPKNEDVDRVNQVRLTGLGEEIIVYKAFDDAVVDHLKLRLNNVMAPSKLEICKGARVMLIKNLNVMHKLVNGSTGTIVGFTNSSKHKTKKICCKDGDKVLPIVKFDSGSQEVIRPCKWEAVEGNKVVATRLQLPLMLAWATSIHKSQGMTLDSLHTDLSKAFGFGMVYVALSRLKSLDGLSLSGFNPKKIKAHPKVLKYYSKIVWNDQQLQIIEAVKRGESVFITGSAGTGKTMLLEHLIELLVKNHGRKTVFVTASTGVAACALRGQTLQSFAGVGLAEADAETLLSRVKSNPRTCNRWTQAKALVIDEISMIDKTLFDKYEYIAREIRCESGNDDKPWGGIQLVVSGDFFQLPPIYARRNGVGFAFEADCWELSFQLFVQLKTVFRQVNSEHVKLLEGIRVGEIDEKCTELLQQCCCKEEPDEAVVRLFPKIKDVERVNRARLTGLGEEIIVYKAFDHAVEDRLKLHLNNVVAPSKLEICKGARVMLIRNLNVKHKLVNGATGTVVGFKKPRIVDAKKICCQDGDKVLPIVKFDSGGEEVIRPEKWEAVQGNMVVATRVQLPLTLAWATSIHKSQGMTLDRLHTDLSEVFDCGMVYVALSRLKSLEGLSLSGFDPSKIKAHPKVLDYYKKHFDKS